MTPAVFEKRDIPFFSNPDGMSCGQCTYKMALTYFYPEKDWSFSVMNQICGAVPGKYTWPYKPLIHLHQMGLDIIVYSVFDTPALIADPEAYMTNAFGRESALDNIQNSDMPSVLAQAKEYLKLTDAGRINVIREYYTPEVMRDLLQQGYVLMLRVNSAALNNLPGTTGHFILAHSYTDHAFICHDPGGSPEEGTARNNHADRIIPDADLMLAASPSSPPVAGETSILIAIKPKNN